MYYIVNYDRFWSYRKPFTNFKTAFMVYELLNDDENVIEYYGENYERQVVWSKDFMK